MKVLIFDSSTIINFAINGLLDLIVKLKKNFNGKFIITDSVKKEIIDRPLLIRKYELPALQIKKLLDEGIFEMPISIGMKDDEIRIKKIEISEIINHSYSTKNNFLHIIDDGEASCIALSLLCSKRGIENIVAVDERTTRILGEMPINLKKIFERKLHTSVELRANLDFMENIKFIRSSELVYVAWKNGLVDLKNGSVLDALLYATKFKGCSISNSEIEELKRIG